MKNTGKTLAFCLALLLSVVAVPLVNAQKSTDGPPGDEADKTDAILAQLKDLKKNVEDLDKRLKSATEEMDKKLKAYFENPDTNSQLRIAKLQADTEDLKKQFTQIQKDLLSMSDKLKDTRPSFYGPPAPTTGRVRLVNAYGDQMTVLINEQSYRLQPGATQLTEPLPVGNFRYQVLGVQSDPQIRRLAPDETFTITIHPR